MNSTEPMILPHPQPDAADVLAALDAQLEAYRRVAELAADQSRHVAAGETEKLLIVLEQRQAQMNQIAELERTIAPAKRSWPTSAAGWNAAERARAERLFGEAKGLLAEITARDAQDMLALQGRRHLVGQQLRQMETGGRAVRQINRRYATAAYDGAKAQMDLRR